MMKTCLRCGIEKPYDQFYKKCDKKDGYDIYCISCGKQYRIKNKDKVFAREKKYRKTHAKQINAYQRKYYAIHKKEFDPENEIKRRKGISISKKKLYSNPLERQKQKERINKPDVLEKISINTRASLARPEIKEKHIAALNKPGTRKKLSEHAKERCKNPEYIKNLLIHAKSEESNNKRQTTIKRLWADPIWKQNIIASIFTIETRKKMSTSLLKISKDPKRIENQSIQKRGEKNPNWNGGTSFDPYCIKWTEEFRERVRAFFGYICVECGSPQNGRRHAVHHVNYDKMICCNDVKPLFVCLCVGCNGRANKNRPYWEQHFTEMIEGYYEGKCYLTKEEMAIWRTTTL